MSSEIEDLKKKIAELEEKIEWLTGSVGINGNGVQQATTLSYDARDMAKVCYQYLCSRQDFNNWYLVEHTIKNLGNGE